MSNDLLMDIYLVHPTVIMTLNEQIRFNQALELLELLEAYSEELFITNNDRYMKKVK